jgi:hypothetical protein
MGVRDQLHTPTSLPCGKSTRYPLLRKLGGINKEAQFKFVFTVYLNTYHYYSVDAHLTFRNVLGVQHILVVSPFL